VVMQGLNRSLSRYQLPPGFQLPTPLQTVVAVHDPAWHYIKPGYDVTACQLQAWAPKPLSGVPLCHIGEAYGNIRTAWTDAAYRTVLLCLNQNFQQSMLPYLGCEQCQSNEVLAVVEHGQVVAAPITNTDEVSPLCGDKCTLPSTDYCHLLYPEPGGPPGTFYNYWGRDPSCHDLCYYASHPPNTSLGQLWGQCPSKRDGDEFHYSVRTECFGTAMGSGKATPQCTGDQEFVGHLDWTA